MSATHLARLKCPECKAYTCHLNALQLDCKSESCRFSQALYCPNPNHPPQAFVQEQNTVHCPSCSLRFSEEKLLFLIEHYYTINTEAVCQVCQGPTIENGLTGLKNRCLHFPECSVQDSLFSQSEQKPSYIFLDFETTGLSSEADHLTEFGAIKVSADGQETLFQSLINPGIDISPKITSITGITTEMLQGAPAIGNVLPAFLDFIEGGTLVAHNATFDMSWLIEKAKKCDCELNLDRPVICTLEWAKQLQEARCSLGILTKKYNIINQKAHRALADAIATKHLFFVFEALNKTKAPIKALSHYKPINTFSNQHTAPVSPI